MKLLRNLTRRKLRTVLTISGITIGIWALVVFGSMANKINALVDGGSQYFGDKIVVSDASGGSFGTAPMELSTAAAVAAIDGVDVAVPSVTVLWDDEGGGGFSVPDQIVGQVAGADKGHENFVLNYAQGRAITEADEGSNVVVLGSDLARKYSLKAGDTVKLRGVDFEVVGVLEPTLTAPDSTAIVPLLASQQLYFETLPPIVRERLKPADLISQVTVYPSAGADIDALAKTIEATVPNTATLTGAEFDSQVG